MPADSDSLRSTGLCLNEDNSHFFLLIEVVSSRERDVVWVEIAFL